MHRYTPTATYAIFYTLLIQGLIIYNKIVKADQIITVYLQVHSEITHLS